MAFKRRALGMVMSSKKPHKVVVNKKRSIHTYSELWHASRCLLNAGVKNAEGSTWQFLSSLVMTAFAFEAYLNHAGSRTIECWSHLERLPPWAKFELLCETLSVRFPEGRGVRPLQTIGTLLSFRNTIAHGKPEEIEATPEVRYADDDFDAYLGEQLLSHWERLVVSDVFAKVARDDVEIVLKRLHDARRDEKEGLFTFGMGLHGASVIHEP